MTDLVIRKMRWEFDETVPFMWQPHNPEFAVICNAFTFIAVPFEKYIISALRTAHDRLASDPAVAAEAEAFLRQEALHSSAHRKHMLALVAKYPGLEQCYRETVRSYDDLIAAHPVEYHAAYIANLEATFTPLFKVILDHRDSMFGGCDDRVGSLMMWHFVEEIEHRSSGLMLYHHLCPDRWYRVKHTGETFRHIGEVSLRIARAFDEHIPLEDRGMSVQKLMSSNMLIDEFKSRRPRSAAPRRSTVLGGVSILALAKMGLRLALSQNPYHDPAEQPLPAWADTWMREYDRGTDMTAFTGSSPGTGTIR